MKFEQDGSLIFLKFEHPENKKGGCHAQFSGTKYKDWSLITPSGDFKQKESDFNCQRHMHAMTNPALWVTNHLYGHLYGTD